MQYFKSCRSISGDLCGSIVRLNIACTMEIGELNCRYFE